MEQGKGSLLVNRYGPYVLVLGIAAFLRFYFIYHPMDLSIFPETLGYNGIDEGEVNTVLIDEMAKLDEHFMEAKVRMSGKKKGLF